MRLAVTGGAAEGKSTVLSYLREAGLSCASADEMARQAFATEEVQGHLAEWLGLPKPIAPEAAREAAFGSDDFRRRLNALMHPRILEMMSDSDADAIEVPLLVEACLHPLFERVWVVTCGPREQLRRLAARLGGEAEARRLLAAQLATRAKCAFADRIVRTNREPHSVRSYVIEAIGRDLPGCLARS
jgi:dephospho-CoA kinase